MVVGAGQIQAYYKKTSSSNKISIGSYSVPANFGTFFGASFDLTLQAINFNPSDGNFFVEYKTFSSPIIYTPTCSYSVIKQETPTFTISPSAVNLNCGDISDRTFTVTNVYNSAGTKSYKWQVGNSWLYNGNPAPNEIITSSNSITLIPAVFPPNNISVIPVLDGISFPMLTSVVSLANFDTSAFSINGVNSFCNNSTFSVNNLPSNTTVTSWSLSNTNIASIQGNGNQATVTTLSEGVVSISATLTNSCGQTAVITKNDINLGDPTVPFTNQINGGYDNVSINSINSFNVSPAIGASSYYWFITTINSSCGGLTTKKTPKFYNSITN